MIQNNQLPTLRAAIDRIIPADDFPSATQAGVDRYILAIFDRDRKPDALLFNEGLFALDEEAKIDGAISFDQSSTSIQDQILDRVQQGITRAVWKSSAAAFFDLLLNLTAEGYFSDPANGGNRDAISWKMVGYDPGANRP
jgi:hypothetical protein